MAQLQAVTGIVASVSKNPVRSKRSHLHFKLEIKLRDQPEVFRVPVRYEPVIPAILKYVQLGDSITIYSPHHSLLSVRNSVELVHLMHRNKILLDFYEARAASRRTAIICLIGTAINVFLLFLYFRKRWVRRWIRDTINSRRFFA